MKLRLWFALCEQVVYQGSPCHRKRARREQLPDTSVDSGANSHTQSDRSSSLVLSWSRGWGWGRGRGSNTLSPRLKS